MNVTMTIVSLLLVLVLLVPSGAAGTDPVANQGTTIFYIHLNL